MPYLYENDRENFAKEIISSSSLGSGYQEDLIFKFKNLNGLEISNQDREKIVKWIKYNQYIAKKIITENINDPLKMIEELNKLA